MSRTHKYWSLLVQTAMDRRSRQGAIDRQVIRRINLAKISAGVQEPPTKLSQLADYLGVEQVKYVPLPTKGRIVLDGGGLVIEINDMLSEFERSFTLAHELSHLILEGRRVAASSVIGMGIRHSTRTSYSGIERSCDIGAEEVLLPGEWLRAKLEGSPSLEAVSRVSEECGYPGDFVAKRLGRLGLWNCRFYWCKMNGAEIMVTESAPQEDAMFLARVEPLNWQRSAIGQCVTRREIVHGNVAFSVHGDVVIYKSECMPLGEDTALIMLDFTKGES